MRRRSSCSNPRGFSKGKETSSLSLLGDEKEAVAHLRSVVFDHDVRCFRGNSMSALARSTFFDLGKVEYFYLSSLNPFIILLSITECLFLQVLTKLGVLANL